MVIGELPSASHPYFVATQFHPEFQSRPQRPSPVFLGLLQAVRDSKRNSSPVKETVSKPTKKPSSQSSSTRKGGRKASVETNKL